MRHRLSVVPTAERHIRTASKWWRKNRPAAPGLFEQELARAFDLITTTPGIGPPAPDSQSVGIRRFHLAGIRYHLYYRVVDDAVEVLAMWHSSRGSGPDL